MQHFKTLSAYLAYMGLPRPEHPQLSVLTAGEGEIMPCPRESSPPISNECYSISLKKVIRAEGNYGRTKYDFTNGALIFLAPRQVMQWDSTLIFEQRGFSINFHEDFIRGTELAREIKQYGFFSYAVNEALHLSPREEQQIEAVVSNIKVEYQNNQDAFSKDIIIAHLSTLLKYANRFYDRQFIGRKSLSTDLLDRFNRELRGYFESGRLETEGVPSVEQLADRLSVSQRYLSDTLRKETGKTSTEHLQLYLINEAKNALLEPGKSIAEVSYELGFEYPQYFSRVFKKQAGESPSAYRARFKLN